MNKDDPTTSGFPSEEVRDTFDREGIILWHQIQKELGLEYEVGYFSERLGKHFTHTSQLESLITVS